MISQEVWAAIFYFSLAISGWCFGRAMGLQIWQEIEDVKNSENNN